MTNQNSTEINSTLNDEQIVDIAKKVDQLIVDIGKEYHPTGIEFAAIALGRLMVFTQHTGCFPTFQEMMGEICKMSEPEFLSKTEDVQPT
jgi:hypothetical protein